MFKKCFIMFFDEVSSNSNLKPHKVFIYLENGDSCEQNWMPQKLLLLNTSLDLRTLDH